MPIQFSEFQTVHIPVPPQPIPIQHYLRQPQRLVYALVESNQMEEREAGIFRLKMRPLSFMQVHIQPTVDIQVWAKGSGVLYLKSVACEIRGVEYIDRRFSLSLAGILRVEQEKDTIVLVGRADLAVSVELPSPLNLTPSPLLEFAGSSLLKGVLLTMKQRLAHRLVQDYQSWVGTVLRETESQDRLLNLSPSRSS